MKPPAFAYHAPSTVEEALALLRGLAPDAKPLAGGQSLVPMMNFRLVHPGHLIDLNRIGGLSYIHLDDGALCIGAMTRHRELERSPIVREQWPLISEAMAHVAHVQIRNRGTIGGSLAHADPAAELPAVMMALDAELVIRNAADSRRLAADDFFLGTLTTALEADELLVGVRIPGVAPGTGWAFDELSRRRGDFALVGVATMIGLDDSGAIAFSRLAFTGMGERPTRSRRAEAVLLGREPSAETFSEAAAEAAEDLRPESDLHASATYRHEVAQVLARRVMSTAAQRAWAAHQ